MTHHGPLPSDIAAHLGEGWSSETLPRPWDGAVLHGPDGLQILINHSSRDQVCLLWFVPAELATTVPNGHTTKEVITTPGRGAASIAAVINRRILPHARHELHIARYHQAKRDQLLRDVAHALGVPARYRNRATLTFNDGRPTPAIDIHLDHHDNTLQLAITMPATQAVALARAIGHALATLDNEPPYTTPT